MREPNRAVFFLVVPALVGAASALWALVISYPKGPAGNPDWPAGLRELANSDASLGGYGRNWRGWGWIDRVYFSGDTPTLNRFLERYSRIENTPLRVVIRLDAKPSTGRLGPSGHFDWSLSVLHRGRGAPTAPAGTSGKYVVTVTVWIDEHIRLDDLYLFGRIAPLVLPSASRT